MSAQPFAVKIGAAALAAMTGAAALYNRDGSVKTYDDDAGLPELPSPYPTAGKLRFAARGAFAVPHFEKDHRGGEDGFYLSVDGRTMGVADGVGGWASKGINPALFTWAFMQHALRHAAANERLTAKGIMEKAYDDTMAEKHQGSCPATIVALNDATTMSVANIGDCGVMVLRGDKIVFRSVEQQHSFNFPYQLGPRETPKLADCKNVEIAADDVVILGSDGLWDNMFNEDVVAMVGKARRTNGGMLDCYKLSEKIAQETLAVSRDKNRESPFGVHAKLAGKRFYGGKEDDITVVVGQLAHVSAEHPVQSVRYHVAEDFLAAELGVNIMDVKNKKSAL
jgi:protein phosphatase PTC7